MMKMGLYHFLTNLKRLQASPGLPEAWRVHVTVSQHPQVRTWGGFKGGRPPAKNEAMYIPTKGCWLLKKIIGSSPSGPWVPWVPWVPWTSHLHHHQRSGKHHSSGFQGSCPPRWKTHLDIWGGSMAMGVAQVRWLVLWGKTLLKWMMTGGTPFLETFIWLLQVQE